MSPSAFGILVSVLFTLLIWTSPPIPDSWRWPLTVITGSGLLFSIVGWSLAHIQTARAFRASRRALHPMLLLGIFIFGGGLAVTSWLLVPKQISTPPNDGMDTSAIVGFGSTGMGMFFVNANGNSLLSYSPKYQLVAFCAFPDPLKDPKDIVLFEKSGRYDIRPTTLQIGIKYDVNKFLETMARKERDDGINFGLLLVPNGMNVDSFSTIRQAQSMGARFLWRGLYVR